MNEFIYRSLFVVADFACLFTIVLLLPYYVYPRIKLKLIPRAKNLKALSFSSFTTAFLYFICFLENYTWYFLLTSIIFIVSSMFFMGQLIEYKRKTTGK
ncbi:MAG: hypothetical protein L3J07_01910 [Candidatus Magasanikbacteria bacterium]|nr:hypothetical protein [Candidatus Magasanikbacteria bacterium]